MNSFDNIHGEMDKIMMDAISHGIRVSNLAVLVARELKESEEFIEMIAMAGMLHDIGKIKLTQYLNGVHPDTLVVEQIKYVRLHSAMSYDIMIQQGFREEMARLVYHHHENQDGTGYPDNLKGNEIPWGARIIRVCDVFIALTSKRDYRDAFNIETAVELMIDEAKNFDLKVFIAFLRVLHSDYYQTIELDQENGNKKYAVT